MTLDGAGVFVDVDGPGLAAGPGRFVDGAGALDGLSAMALNPESWSSCTIYRQGLVMR